MMVVSAEQVLAALTPAALVAAMRSGFARGGKTPPRTHHDIADRNGDTATLLIMPAWREGGALGVKIASVHSGNAGRGLPTVMAQYLLFSATTGEVHALIDGRALTAVRTGAVSALAADLLAPTSARCLAMIGTGTLAPHMVRAHCAVRQIAEVRIVGRDPEKAAALATILQSEGIPASALTTLTDAVRTADIVSCATTSCTPILSADMLRHDVHVDLVGGFRPAMREADDSVMAGAMIVADCTAAVAECGDLIAPVATGEVDPARIMLLDDLVREHPWLRPAGSRTVFKSVGTALADLIAAEALIAALTGLVPHPVQLRKEARGVQ